MIEAKILMPFKKFAESVLQLIVHDRKKKIKGTFRNKRTNNIISGDNFEAVVIGHGTAEESYRAYIAWYNHTRNSDKESEREFVSAEWDSKL
jgi:hypothetical protein